MSAATGRVPTRTGTTRVDHPWTVDGAPPRVVTGVLLRAAVAVAAVATVLLVVLAAGGGGLRPVALVLVAVLAVGVVALPTSPLPTVFVLVTALVVLDAGEPVWVAAAAGSLLHAVHVGVAWCAVVPPRGRVELAALLPSARRWVLAQLLCVPVVVVVALLAPGPLAPGGWSTVVAAAGAVALLGAGVVVVRLVVRAVRAES